METKEPSLFNRLVKGIFNRETLSYLFFGVLTTIVNTLAFELFYARLGFTSVIAKCFAFCCAVVFAFFTNKIFVFRQRSWRPRVVGKEFSAFFLTRLGAFFLELLGLMLLDYGLHVGNYSILGIDGVSISQFALSLISVVLNYVFSKFWIFKKK